MCTVIKEAIQRLTVTSALFLTLIISSVARAHNSCEVEELVKCAQPLQILQETGLSFIASKKDLEIICPDLHASLKCVHSYTRRCLTLEQLRHFNMLFNGTSLMVKELCTEGAYQEEYLRFAPCMRKVTPRNDICMEDYRLALESLKEIEARNASFVQAKDPFMRRVCCSFQEYVNCYTHSVEIICGVEAARFNTAFMDKMSASMIQVHCTAYRDGEERCPGMYSASTTINYSFSLVLLCLIAITTLFRSLR